MSNDENYFTYDAINYLDKDIYNILQNNSVDEIIIIPFKINFNGLHPFNTFLLVNDFVGSLNFPYFNIIQNTNTDEMLLSSLSLYTYSILLSGNNSDIINYDLENFKNLLDFKGFYIYENKVYVFIDLSKIDINTSLINKNSLYWFALVDEIVNKKQLCNIPINDEVSYFFMNNSKFIYFKNSKENQIEIPIVAYTGTHEKNLQFIFIFGNTLCDNNSILSSGYYFTDYNNAIRYGGWTKDYNTDFKYGKKITEGDSGKYNKGGIVRYALFLGNNCVKLNDPNDIVDQSDIKKERTLYESSNFDKKNTDYLYEKMTIRISDYDGLWKQTYDSVYLGKILFDNGTYLENTPMYVLKDYCNHTPLSYHYIDKTTLGNEFNEHDNYQIM